MPNRLLGVGRKVRTTSSIITRHHLTKMMLTTRAAGASRAAVGLVRAFSTTPAAFKPRADIGKFNLTQVPTFQFDDASSLEHRRLMGIEESRELIARTITDAEALAGQYLVFRGHIGQCRAPGAAQQLLSFTSCS